MRKQGGQVKELTGRRFGKLLVVSFSHTDGKGAHWLCRCDCGAEKIIKAQQLRHQGTQSCGCQHKEAMKARRLDGEAALWRQALRGCKGNAKQRKHVWEISDEHALSLMGQDCHYCKAPPSNIVAYEKDRSRILLVNGIDRLENEIGYVAGNVVPCCKRCNLAKRDMSVREFLTWAHQLARHTKEPEFELFDLDKRDLSRHPSIKTVIELFA